MQQDTILVTGACGQIGSELVMSLRKIYKQVVASDLREPMGELKESGPFELLDVLDKKQLGAIVAKYQVTQIYHLAAILSATGERNPKMAWQINMDGLHNILEVAIEYKLQKVFFPSTIAVFGPTTPPYMTPQHTIAEPTTVYGISKLTGESWCAYYHAKKGLDVRSLRYPGLISYKTQAGGGTTDYAVEIFFDAIKNKAYNCFLAKDTMLPMMYMSDAIRGTIALMEAPSEKITVRSSYNFAAISFTPEELANEIKKHLPEFQVSYQPDYRQNIAASWPKSIDDSIARADWGWQHEYNLQTMCTDMLQHIAAMQHIIL